MSKHLSAKKSPVTSPYQNKEIATLQSRLTQSINSVFDPKTPIKSDDDFLDKDYATENLTSDFTDINEEYKNPYLALAEKAKAYVKQKEAEAPKKSQVPSATSSAKKADNGTFLTGIGLEKTQPVVPVKKEESEEEEADDDLPGLDYKDVLQGASGAGGEFDDLEELRKMIKQTRKDMKDYGRELFDLKNIIDEVNDYAGKELGYSANYDHIRTVEHTIKDLRQNGEFKFMKKTQSSVKNLKGPAPAPASTSISTSTAMKTPQKEPGSAGKSYVKSTTAESFPSRSVRAGGSTSSNVMRNFGVKK